jgi:transposase-like protein
MGRILEDSSTTTRPSPSSGDERSCQYAAYPLSLRNLEEMMAERGVVVDHATVHRWALKILPVLAVVFRRRKRAVGSSSRVDKTYVKVGGRWKYLYRAVVKCSNGGTASPWRAAWRRHRPRSQLVRSLLIRKYLT